MPVEYTDILIRVYRFDSEGGSYPTEASLNDGSFFGEGRLRLDREELLRCHADVRKYGRTLFDALVSGPIRSAYDKAAALAAAETAGKLRVRLWIDDKAAELHALAWERVHQESGGQLAAVACSELTPFSRYTGLELPQPAPLTDFPLRLFVVIASPARLPRGLKPIAVAEQIEALGHALAPFRDQIKTTVLPGVQSQRGDEENVPDLRHLCIVEGESSLENILRNLPGQDVLHLVCHGSFSRETDSGPGTATLFLEAEDGDASIVSDEEFVSGVASAERTPHLIFLAACESARGDSEHPFVGLGPKLVAAGTPAVVAMQDRVPVALVRRLTADFYRNLFEHGRVDVALNQARRLLSGQGRLDWAIPVLFSRLDQNRLAVFLPVRRYRINGALLVAAVLLMAIWFYRHVYQFLVPGLVVTGSLAIVLALVNWLWGNRLRSWIEDWMGRRTSTAVLAGTLFLLGVLSALTASISVGLEQGGSSMDDEVRVEFREQGQSVMQGALHPNRPLAGRLFLGRFSRVPLELHVITPPAFENLELEIRPWSSVHLNFPSDFQQILVVRILPGVFLASDFPPERVSSDRTFSLQVRINGRDLQPVADVRRGQNFFLGADGETLLWIRNQAGDSSSVQSYLAGVPRLSAPQREAWRRAWEEQGIAIGSSLRRGDVVEVEFIDDASSKILARKRISLSDEDNQERIRNIFVTKSEGLDEDVNP